MTHTPDLPRGDHLRPAISAMISTHGARRVVFAVLQALFDFRTEKGRVPDTRGLSNHLRRDIGLPPKAAGPPHWTKYR